MSRFGTLSTNKRKAIDALLSENTVAAAAGACGLGRRTIFRYLSDRDFMTALREREAEARAQTTAALLGGAGAALETLRAVMKDKEASHSAKVAAARVWLAASDKGAETELVLEKIGELERVVYGQHKG